MTALPDQATNDQLDQSTDDPRQARNEIVGLVDKFNGVRSFLSGLLGSDGEAPTARTALGLGGLATKSKVGAADLDPKSVDINKIGDSIPGGVLTFTKTNGEAVVIPPGVAGEALISNGPDELPTWGQVNGLKFWQQYVSYPGNGQQIDFDHVGVFTELYSMTYTVFLRVSSLVGGGQVPQDLGYEYGRIVQWSGFDSAASHRGYALRYFSKNESTLQLPDNTPYIPEWGTGIHKAIDVSKWQVGLRIIGI